jgi:asparagine synthetase B (glutamine-hydrolysing)
MAMLWAMRLALAPLAERFGPENERRSMLLSSSRDMQDVGLPELPAGHTALHRQLFRDHSRDVLPALLHYGDAISMAHGIESRLPFMDYRLVEWVFREAPVLIRDGFSKWPVRGYLKKKGYGDIADRTDKLGYVTPLDRWMSSSSGRDMLESMFDANAPLREWFDMTRVRPLVDRAEAGDPLALNHGYKFLTTHIWLNQLKVVRTTPRERPHTVPTQPLSASAG